MYFKIIRFLSFAICISTILFSCKKENSLPAPTSLNFSNITDSSCLINWAIVNGAGSYNITISTDASFINVVTGYNSLNVTNTSIGVTILSPYKQYFVKVVATDGQVFSEPVTGDFLTNDADGLVILPSDESDLYAFDCRNGNVKWIFNGAPITATPIIQDSIVYVGSTNGRLYAIRISDGSVKWRTAATTNAGTFLANALIKNGVVYIGDYRGRCHAYNVSDGSAKWTYDILGPYTNVNSTPILNGNSIYFASYDGKIYALDAATGAYKWNTVSTGNPIESGMALVNNTIYVGALPRVYAFDANTGNTKWITTTPTFTQYISSPTIADNTVFIGGGDVIMYAYKTTDGSILWTKLLTPAGSINSSPVYRNGVIYIGGGNGIMYALQSANGNLVWQNSDAGSIQNIYSGPTLSEKVLYSGTLGGKLIAINIQSGSTKWIKAITGARFYASPSVITYKGNIFYPGISGDMQ
jgi:outer membrane protein assembly factor BamB